MNSYNIEPFDPQKITDETFWEDFYTFYVAYFKEKHPDDPPTPKERIMISLKDPPPDWYVYYWLVQAKNENTIVGLSYLYISKENHPAYETNKHIAKGQIIILKKHQRKGIGTDIIPLFIEKAKEHNRTLLQSGSDQPSGNNFCIKLGGKAAIRGSENRLQMDEVNWDLVKEWIDNRPKKASNVVLERFNDVSDDDIDEYCIIYTDTMNQQPFGEIEGRIKVTPETRRTEEERLKKRNGIWTTIISREEDGVISGLTEIIYFPDKPSFVNQELTGVNENYRERGLGKWLKAAMLTWIKDEYPQVKTIITGNATTNAPMLSINNRLGFKEYKSETDYKFQIEKLEGKLASLS